MNWAFLVKLLYPPPAAPPPPREDSSRGAETSENKKEKLQKCIETSEAKPNNNRKYPPLAGAGVDSK